MLNWLMVAAVVATLIFAMIIIRNAPVRPEAIAPGGTHLRVAATEAAMIGVIARITAGDITVERTLPRASFALEPGQTLDRRIPPGPCEVELVVTFQRGDVRRATLGAEISGCSVIVQRAGEVLDDGFMRPGGTGTVMGTIPAFLGSAVQQVIYLIEHDGEAAMRFRAIWRPEDSMIPLPLPSDGAPLLFDGAQHGEQLAMRFNCVACHQSSSETRQAWLSRYAAPVLGDIGARAKPAWLQSWLMAPHRLTPGVRMPTVVHDAEQALDLTHFLVSMGGPIESPRRAPDADLVATGMVAYHAVGCVACHGPLEPIESLPGGRVSPYQPLENYVSLGRPTLKTTQRSLADFLADPVAWHPAGTMPGMQLTSIEARAIAAYLLSRGSDEGAPGDAELFTLDPQRVARGEGLFASSGCADCHTLGSNRTAIASTLTAPPLESLFGEKALARGCLGEAADGAAPQFEFGASDRVHLRDFLVSLAERVSDNVPIDQLAIELTTLDCLACHTYAGHGGPEPAVLNYFGTLAEADLGDEGRVPPTLTDAGAKLRPRALRAALAEHARARPYMSVRMPDFGAANVDHLPALFMAAAGVGPEPLEEPQFTDGTASIGRELVGAGGLDCIQCHNIAGHAATGTPGPDLANVTARLRYENYARWLHNPANVRLGTRMPSFFAGGVSGQTQHYGGRAEDQIEAIWQYLSQIEMLPLPEGLTNPSSLDLAVTDEPLVLRAFMQSAGVRALPSILNEAIASRN